MAAVKDLPEEIADSWMDFERDEGTLEHMEVCEGRTREKLERVADERRKAEKEVSAKSEPPKKASKRKSDDAGKWKALSCSQSKIVRSEKTRERQKPRVDTEGGKSNNNETESRSKVLSPPPGFKAATEGKSVDADNQKDMDNDVTIFVSNLDYTATEEEVRDGLKPAGSIKLFKMIKDYKGRSKGYCYVQLASAVRIYFLDRSRRKNMTRYSRKYRIKTI